MPKRTIFMARSRKDLISTEALICALHECSEEWRVAPIIPTSANWMLTAKQDVLDSVVFVFCLSTESMCSKPCRMELSYALRLRKPLLTVGLEDGARNSLPRRLRTGPYVPATGSWPEIASKVLLELERLTITRTHRAVIEDT
jgi:hypothetical protein